MLFEKLHTKENELTPSDIKTIREEVAGEVNEAFVFAMRSKFPEESSAFEGVYAS